LENDFLIFSIIIGIIISLPIMLQERLLITQVDISKMSPYEKVKLYARLEMQEQMLVKGHEDFEESVESGEEE